jgi:hypothetical protein
MWASIPDSHATKFTDAVLSIKSQVPEGYKIYVTDKAELLEPIFAEQKGVKFRPEYVETWHARHIPGNSVCIGNSRWDKHPAYTGPEDTQVFVYIPKLAEERDAEARQKEWAAKEKARIDAKAAKEKVAVEGAAAPEGALAAGGPADPTLTVDDPTSTSKKAATKKAATKKAATKKAATKKRSV